MVKKFTYKELKQDVVTAKTSDPNSPYKYVEETLKMADNSKEVVGVLLDQGMVKAELNHDAMSEIDPYLEQGV